MTVNCRPHNCVRPKKCANKATPIRHKAISWQEVFAPRTNRLSEVQNHRIRIVALRHAAGQQARMPYAFHAHRTAIAQQEKRLELLQKRKNVWAWFTMRNVPQYCATKVVKTLIHCKGPDKQIKCTHLQKQSVVEHSPGDLLWTNSYGKRIGIFPLPTGKLSN
jgi:hypothetical protein